MIGGNRNRMPYGSVTAVLVAIIVVATVVAPAFGTVVVSDSPCNWTEDDEDALMTIMRTTIGEHYSEFAVDSVEVDYSIEEYGLCSYTVTLKNSDGMLLRLNIFERYGIVSGFRWITDVGALSPLGPVSIKISESVASISTNKVFDHLSSLLSKMPVRNIDADLVSIIGRSAGELVLHPYTDMGRYRASVRYGEYTAEITLMNLSAKRYLIVVNVIKDEEIPGDVTVPVRVLGASFMVVGERAYQYDLWYMPLKIEVQASGRSPSEIMNTVVDALASKGYIIKNITFIGAERLIKQKYINVVNDTITYTKVVYKYRVIASRTNKEETLIVGVDPENLNMKATAYALDSSTIQSINQESGTYQTGDKEMPFSASLMLGLVASALIVIISGALIKHKLSNKT